MSKGSGNRDQGSGEKPACHSEPYVIPSTALRAGSERSEGPHGWGRAKNLLARRLRGRFFARRVRTAAAQNDSVG